MSVDPGEDESLDTKNGSEQMAGKYDSASGSTDCDEQLTLREARAVFYRGNGCAQDGGAHDQTWSPLACRDLKVYLPNFQWRRRALPLHDLHHVITGYEFSPRGEFQVAAWEFAAGRYPSALSTFFCLPLVCLGAAVIPRKTFAAFIRGRHSKTLYSPLDVDTLLDRTVGDVRRECLPAEAVSARAWDWGAFVLLVVVSSAVLMTPLVALSALWLIWR
jgi:hypothetical protein